VASPAFNRGPSDEGAIMAGIDELIGVYLQACAVEGKTQGTIQSYRASLHDFRRVGFHLGLPDEIDKYGVPDAYAFLADVQGRGASAAYQHRRHREVKTFFSWCKRMDFVAENVFARVPLVKREQQMIAPFSSNDIESLLLASDRSTRLGRRNFALTLFLLDSGVRAAECVSLNLCDLDHSARRVRVLHGKGRKQRWVGVSGRTLAALDAYLQDWPAIDDGPLFLSRRGARMHPNALNQLFTKLGRRADVHDVHPHRFRHTFATWSIRASAREIDVQNLLGHSSMTMTQRYARTYSSEQALVAHGLFSPVAQLDAALGVFPGS